MLADMELNSAAAAVHNYSVSPQFSQIAITSPMSIDMNNLRITASSLSPSFSPLTTSMGSQVHSVDSAANTITINSSSPHHHQQAAAVASVLHQQHQQHHSQQHLQQQLHQHNSSVSGLLSPGLMDTSSGLFGGGAGGGSSGGGGGVGGGSGGSAAATTSLDYGIGGGSGGGLDNPDTKEGIEELCPVCGDKVSGYHYGLLTCESCKGFFKRTVQNKKVYTCVADRQCQIDKTQRKRCPYCRFQKCLDVGMKLEAVRQDRMRGGRNKFGPMYKRDRARKLQMLRQRQTTHPGLLPARTAAAAVQYTTALGSYTTSAGGGIHIKEEIQSPFLSSSTSSPDSSPAPMRGVLHGAGGPSHPPGSLITNNENIALWVGTGDGGGAGGGGSTQQVPIRTLPRHAPGTSELVRELVNSLEDQDWMGSLTTLLQNQSYNQCEVDLFELMCKVLDQSLFAQVDWARNSIFFKDLRVDDQMKLLQQSWSDMLLLDHLHQRLHHKMTTEMPLANGQKFNLLTLALLGNDQYEPNFHTLLNKMLLMGVDSAEYCLIKFTMLLNSEPCVADNRPLTDQLSVDTASEHVRAAMMEYCLMNHGETVGQERYQKLISLVPEIHYIADSGEKYLYLKMMHSGSSSQTLLMEMLHTKRR